MTNTRYWTVVLLALGLSACEGEFSYTSSTPHTSASSEKFVENTPDPPIAQSVCGDGLISGQEMCDGTCPVSCDDGNTCTEDSVEGSSESCDAQCANVDITLCIDGDGCCPNGCDADTDSDCSDSCGDGVVDENETCDGNCPTACDDQNACTTSRMTGSPDRCNVQCSTIEVTACIDADGCCPMGCTSDTDSDCGAVCGNGVIEGIETCDGDCPTDCDDGDACTENELRGDASTCDAVCRHVEVTRCEDDDGCCPAGCSMANDSDCTSECGNDIVEDGETCDGACPTDCNDGDRCTTDVLTGDPSTCDVRCEYSEITMCIDGDGCCPDACDETNDTDCSSVCGNGILEAGETCDPQEDCPTSCDDQDACTTDRLAGSPQTCDAVCLYQAITMCIDGDGCCPNGCNANNDSDCAATCGNSVLEPGETCDPPGSCPSAADCDDGDACTAGALVGDAASCTAQCVYTDVTACISGDGCCPSGCTADQDSDCTAVCDNGVIEDGEVCDPIASCPTSCDDQDACTKDTLVGSASTCSSMCQYTDITMCIDGDGCCPPGCDSTNDDDCNAVCGNSIVEPGETCDGDCPTAADCDDGKACTADALSGSAATCTAMCTNTDITACVDGDGCCPSGCNSDNDDDCSAVIDCRDAASWPSAWAQLEDEILTETNARRTQPQTCRGTSYPAQPALNFNAKLRESARCHALDMATNNFFNHTGSDGSSAGDRMTAAGYNWRYYSENIAAGNDTAVAIVDQWMNSTSGHCEAIMKARSIDLGVGFAYDASATYKHYSVQNFGEPK